MLCGMWGLISLTRGRTHTPCRGRHSLNPWTAREVPKNHLYWNTFRFRKELQRQYMENSYILLTKLPLFTFRQLQYSYRN